MLAYTVPHVNLSKFGHKRAGMAWSTRTGTDTVKFHVFHTFYYFDRSGRNYGKFWFNRFNVIG